MSFVTLVTGPSGKARECAIASRLDPHVFSVVILEGFPSGNSILENQSSHPNLKILRIAAGCMCCTGNLVLRVTLNRVLRESPQQIFLSLTDAEHGDALRSFLTAAPYDTLLTLTENCRA